MDERIGRLVRDHLSDEQISQLIQEARAEAFDEARNIIKGALVQSILERASDDLEREELAGLELTKDKKRIQAEVEAIKEKIVENERLLAQAATLHREPEKVRPVEGEGIYVYGVAGEQPLTGLPTAGIDPSFPVYALRYASGKGRSIQAIVSRVSLTEFGEEALKTNLEDLAWLQTNAPAHQSVLEEVMEGVALVPLRFCTIFRSEERVREMLDRNYHQLTGDLIRLEGHQEWGVKAFYDGERLAQQAYEDSEEIKALRIEMASKPHGAAYFVQKKLEEAVAREARRLVDECAWRSHDRLSTHAEEAVSNPLQARELADREEPMLLNGAYLVPIEGLVDFRAALTDLEAENGECGVSYELTGPWPAYNFVATNTETAVSDE